MLAVLGACANQGDHPMAIADNSINYIELRATDMAATKRFYGEAFGWQWVDYGPAYVSFTGAGVDGGFHLDEESNDTPPRQPVPSALIVLYARDLEAALERVEEAGGTIAKPIFSFPGGRRFHFIDPNGNELAVWSE